MVVSKVAYLVGVPKSIFENEHEPPQLEWYEEMDREKDARIIRNLCMLRTAIERNFRKIRQATIYDLKSILSLPEYVPRESIDQLLHDGISIYKANAQPIQYILDINKYIASRINNCKRLLPIWLKWDYIRQLFIMPKGTTEKGAKAAAAEYYAKLDNYPYQVYINWAFSAPLGNILYNDKKFVQLLYEYHEDYFADMSRVSDAGLIAKNGIYEFLERSSRTVMVVDCENADPYKLYATLKNLNQAALLEKIGKIILFDDVHTTSAWKILEQFTQVPIEHQLIKRVKESKSLVDICLTAGACREFFKNNTDSFILASSDSDYWGLISALPEAHFLVLVEEDKCSPTIKRAMRDAGIMYCYTDDFCTGNSDEIRIQTVLNEVKAELDYQVQFNIQDILHSAYQSTRANLSTGEQRQFYERYIKPMRLEIDKEGNVSVKLGPL